MNNLTFGPGSPKPFHTYSRGDIDLESGNFKKPRKPKSSVVPRFIRMIKSIGNQINYFYKLHPLAVFVASLIFGLGVLIVLSMYESSFRLMKYRNDKLSLVSYSYPLKNLHNLVMVAGHSIYVSRSCGKFDSEDSWFLEPYQKHPGQASTFIAHIKEGVKIAAEDESALLLFSGGETRNNAGPRSEAQSYWTVAEAKGWFACTFQRAKSVSIELGLENELLEYGSSGLVSFLQSAPSVQMLGLCFFALPNSIVDGAFYLYPILHRTSLF